MPTLLGAAATLRAVSSCRPLLPSHQLSQCALRKISAKSSDWVVQPRFFPTEHVPLLPTDVRFEEERFVSYKAERFYHVRLGEILKSKYQVVAKLGYGTASTVWLCRDLHTNSLRTVKVCMLGEENSQELAISHHLKSIDTVHAGKSYFRVTLDDFHVEGPHGLHQCLVFPTLGRTLTSLRDLFPDRALDKTLLQKYLIVIITTFDFMHQAGVVHTDLSPNNILVGIEDSKVSKIEEAELSSPSPREVLPDRTIHLSYDMPTSYKPPFVTDFGAAYLGEPDQKFKGDVMPGVFRAPEIVAGMDWDSKIDMWSFGVMIWNLFEDGNLFNPYKDDCLNDELHLAQMVSFMGPPPAEFLRRSESCRKYWDRESNWIAATSIPD